MHFERWGLEERIAVARRELGIEEEEGEGKKERERREVLERGDECAERGEWWNAVSGAYRDMEVLWTRTS